MITLSGIPQIDTERLILRAPLAADWPAFRDYRVSDRTAFTGGAKTEPQAAEQFASFFGHWIMRGFGRFIAMDRATGLGIGHFGPMQWHDSAEPELTWSLWSAAAEGKGLAVEAATAMHRWLFGVFGLTSARAEVHRDNFASHAIARHLGGKVIAGQRPTWFDDGDVYHFAKRGAV